jgi:hypothetical protein
MVRSDSWSIFHRPRTVPVGRIGPEEISSDEARADEKPWPADYQVTVAIELPKMGGKYRRPYVAVWMENEDGKAVRTVSVWGNQPRWIGELSGWWKFARDDQALVKAVSRATRGPGKYSVIWDGKDNAGKALPSGPVHGQGRSSPGTRQACHADRDHSLPGQSRDGSTCQECRDGRDRRDV